MKPAAAARWLLLALAGVYTHVFLDWLNNYGVRLLTPFSWQWFYGDRSSSSIRGYGCAGGVWLAQPGGADDRRVGARMVTACYILVMVMSARAARGIVEHVWRETHGVAPVR